MSFPIRHVHLPSPLHQRCWPSPPASDNGDLADHLVTSSAPNTSPVRSPRNSISDNRKSIDIAYFPLLATSPASNDSFASRTVACPASQVTTRHVASAWAILRLRHPVLGSVGLVDPFGKVSYTYDPPSEPETAILDAEFSLENRRKYSEADLIESYKTGTRRVSRSHLSHLFFSLVIAGDGGSLISPPLTPPLPTLDVNGDASHSLAELSLLLCTPHYVASNKDLVTYIDELVALLIAHPQNDLQEMLIDECARAVGKQSSADSVPTMTSNPPSFATNSIKMRFPPGGRFLRSVQV